jgi:hypothetical protein
MLRKPFTYTKESAAFLKSFAKEVSAKLDAFRSQFISAANIHAFNHGMRWQSHNSSTPEEISTLQLIKNEVTVEKSDLVEYNFDAINQTAINLANEMSAAFVKTMYSTISESCDKSGQLVDGAGRSFAESMLEMLEKLEFTVDRDGNPSIPSIHLNPDTYEKLKADPQLNDPKYKAKFDEIRVQKTTEALSREQARLAKYRANDDQS